MGRKCYEIIIESSGVAWNFSKKEAVVDAVEALFGKESADKVSEWIETVIEGTFRSEKFYIHSIVY